MQSPPLDDDENDDIVIDDDDADSRKDALLVAMTGCYGKDKQNRFNLPCIQRSWDFIMWCICY